MWGAIVRAMHTRPCGGSGLTAPKSPNWCGTKRLWERSFKVSRDGRRASGVFPWPEAGMVELPNGRRHGFGTGCWASMALDDTYRLWYFDGAHRNLTLVETTSGRSWKVNISNAPGIGGFEVYHPRWGNHPRFMSMTGPYAVGSDGNRVRGGGAGVEVYVGRFADDWSRSSAGCV